MNHTYRISFLFSLTCFLIVLFGILAFGISAKNTSFYTLINAGDLHIQSFVVRHASSVLTSIMQIITHLADATVIITIQIILIGVLIAYREKLLATFFLISLILGQVLTSLIKYSIQRIRPQDLSTYVPWMSYSFPSGHALTAMLFYGFLGYCLLYIFQKKSHKVYVVIITSLLIFLIGCSRIVLNVHWTSDVLGGWLFGGAFLSFLILLFTYFQKKIVRGRYASS